ncbi:unnamed protein product [Bursaphelenchus xylophilus]|uniref:Protein RFT1 homolog n=1 Tax=Bursaphelenchus xylophilus TaxID=6326 RepID=A0A1I7RIA7_BURXY|nr:unnamed protein product [Bursaphelenchus xylophilus]CAG9115042.1 unnamed protein product [Bursaphelenchus xylophilus]
MVSSIGDILKANFTGQIVGRLFTFLINMYFIRTVSGEVLGLINVRLNLLYMTINFLVSEPLRKTCLSADLTVKDSMVYAWISPILAIPIALLLSFVWTLLPTMSAVSEADYTVLVGCFCMASLMESLAEPLAILAMKNGQNNLFAFSQSFLLISNKFVALFLILAGVSSTTALCCGQLFGSLIYTLLLYFSFIRAYFRKELDFWPFMQMVPKYELKYLRLLATLLLHSAQKQVLTDGSAYVMTFTKQLSLSEQAAYDAIERLGSLVVRIVLRPLEESCAVYFSSRLERSQAASVPRPLIEFFQALLRNIFTLGMVVCVFAIPYSSIAVQIYGGELLKQNRGAFILTLYAFYLLSMAMNGLLECFAFAAMSSEGILKHTKFLFISSLIHLALNIGLMHYIGAPGFVIANIANSLLRAGYNWMYIAQMRGLNNEIFSIWKVLPDWNVFTQMFMSLVVTTLSGLIFFSTPGLAYTGAHLAVGLVMFVQMMIFLLQNGEFYQRLWEKLD